MLIVETLTQLEGIIYLETSLIAQKEKLYSPVKSTEKDSLACKLEKNFTITFTQRVVLTTNMSVVS